MIQTILLDKDLTKMLRWVAKGAINDNVRPVLGYVEVKEPYIQSTDGYHVRRLIFGGEKQFKNFLPTGYYNIIGFVKNCVVVDYFEMMDKFPDIDSVAFHMDKMKKQIRVDHKEMVDVRCNIAFTSKFLKGILDYRVDYKSDMSVIHFGSENMPLYIEVATQDTRLFGDIKLEAYLMPCYKQGVIGVQVV